MSNDYIKKQDLKEWIKHRLKQVEDNIAFYRQADVNFFEENRFLSIYDIEKTIYQHTGFRNALEELLKKLQAEG